MSHEGLRLIGTDLVRTICVSVNVEEFVIMGFECTYLLTSFQQSVVLPLDGLANQRHIDSVLPWYSPRIYLAPQLIFFQTARVYQGVLIVLGV